MTTKTCSKCKQAKELACFNKCSANKDSLSYWCRDCSNSEKKKWHKKNKSEQNKKSLEYYRSKSEELKKKMRENYSMNRLERIEYSKNYRIRNKEKVIKQQKEYAEKNREELRKRSRKWCAENKDKVREFTAARRAKLRGAKIKISEQHADEIRYIYWLASDLSAITGEDYHVDHIVPLSGKNVCGLHVPWNLQILPSDLNQKKYNHFDESLAIAS